MLCLVGIAIPANAEVKTATFTISKSDMTGNSSPYSYSMTSDDKLISLAFTAGRKDKYLMNNGSTMTISVGADVVVKGISFTSTGGGNIGDGSTFEISSGSQVIGTTDKAPAKNSTFSWTGSAEYPTLTVTSKLIDASSTKDPAYVQITQVVVTYESKTVDPNAEYTTTLSVADLDIADGVNSKNGQIDRDNVAGFKFEFKGNDAAKSYHNSKDEPYIVFRYKNATDVASVTISSVDGLKIKSLDVTVNEGYLRYTSIDADGYERSILNSTMTITNNDASKLASSITITHKPLADKSADFKIVSFKITTIGKPTVTTITPTITFEPASVNLQVGNNKNVTVTTVPSCLYNFSIKSGDESIAKYTENNGKKTITAVAEGTTKLTASYAPSSKYFAAATATLPITVTPAPLRTTDVWVFDKDLAEDNTTGIAHNDDFSSETLWSLFGNGSEEYKYNLEVQDPPQELVLSNGNTVGNTKDLFFTVGSAGHLSILKDNYLRMDESGKITIKSVPKGTNLLITAESTSKSRISGFKISGESNLDFADEDLTYSKNRQVFMLKTNFTDVPSKDIFFQPIDGIKIFKIELNQKKIPTINASTTLTKDPKVKEYQVNSGADIPVTFKIKESDVDGTLYLYSVDQTVASATPVTVGVKSGTAASATITAKALKNGVAHIVARFTPVDGENSYTYGYSSFKVSVSDGTVFRLVSGDNPEVGQVVTSVPGITMTFGGWADWSKGTYKDNHKEPDKWKKVEHEAYVETYSGFDYSSSANENSAYEENDQYSNPFFAKYDGKEYWYKEGENNPYHMPVFGGFLKFLPEKNGTLTVYIHQNGAVCQVNHDDGTQKFNPYKLHMRSYYIGDETGKLYGDGEVTVETLASADEVWNGDYNDPNSGIAKAWGTMTNEKRASFDEEDQTDYTEEYQRYKEDFDYFNSSDNGGFNYGTNPPTQEPQEVKCFQGGWVMLNEGASKYTLPVKAGKTYFFFTNRTKLGFYGFEFKPDVDGNVPESDIQTLNFPSESSTEPFNVTLDETKHYYKVDPTFKKTLKAGMWNGVCLPFSMTEEQTKAAFGENCDVLDYDRIEGNKIIFRKHYYQMIVAGRPYAIYVPVPNGMQRGDDFTMPVPTGFISTSAEALQGPINVASGSYVWKGNYRKLVKSAASSDADAVLPKYAYFWSPTLTSEGKTNMSQNTSGKSTLRGYRAFLTTTDGTSSAKTLSISFDGIDETTTGIDSVISDLSDPETNGRVYNLNGQLISEKGLAGLPQGIYIMNGKKYVVR